jgi:dipeptidyl aminopeptidase/acylaminoacyl peptidase
MHLGLGRREERHERYGWHRRSGALPDGAAGLRCDQSNDGVYACIGDFSKAADSAAVDIADQLKCPLLVLHGANDKVVPVDTGQQAVNKAKAAHKTADIVVYPDAGHGFHADHRPSNVPADAADCWIRALAWFRKYGVVPQGGA